jgi:hypothetical protein
VNKQRKAKLAARALAYSNANQDRGADSFSFEDGYRAAMRDARKAIGHGTLTAPLSVTRQSVIASRITRFLRPLR